MARLPQTRSATDNGLVYVVRDGNAYKIGFTRDRLRRRARDAGGQVILTIRTGQRPSVLETIIHRRFRAKGLPDHKSNQGGKREWFALNQADIEWLKGLSDYAAIG